jgi:predicted nucleic-acid-binding Zn-ribbon protein
MRKTLQCPKCEGRKLWRIEEMRERGPSHAHTEPLGLDLVQKRWVGGMTSRGTFETFICAGCGYTEWYAHGLEKLEADEKRGVHFIDTEPDGGLR